MADQQMHIGQSGAAYYDDTLVGWYPAPNDTIPLGGALCPTMYVTDDPIYDLNVSNKKYVDYCALFEKSVHKDAQPKVRALVDGGGFFNVLPTILTSGILTVGVTYTIFDWIADDDFVNVGGANVDGTVFVATGTTPTHWLHKSELIGSQTLGSATFPWSALYASTVYASTVYASTIYATSSLTIGSLAGILKAVAGVVGTVTIGSSLSYTAPTLDTIQDIRTTASPTFAGLGATPIVTSYVGPHTLGGAIVTSAQFTFRGAFTSSPGNVIGNYYVSDLTPGGTNNSVYGFSSSLILRMVAGQTHPLFAVLNFNAPGIAPASGATITETATLRIGGASTEGVTNYAVNIVSGASRFGALTASLPVVTNTDKVLASLAYTGATSFRKNLGLETDDSPTFAGLTIGTLGGVLKGLAGVVGVATIGTSLSFSDPTLDAVQDIRTTAGPSFDHLHLTIAIGTAPLTITSTTMCSNLNADRLDGYHASSFWGGGATVEHALLSTIHSDTLAASAILGDIIHGNVTPVWARLGGNITTTKKFLAQTGTGAISAVPAWDTIVDGDVPATHSGSAHHVAVTLATAGDTLLGLSGQALDLDTQAANLGFFGPVSGAVAAPTFRALVNADFPATLNPTFAGLTVGTLAGVLKATAGVLAGSAVHADLGSIGANDHHNAVTVSAPISLATQALSLVNDVVGTITEIDTGVVASSHTVIPTSQAVVTAIGVHAALITGIHGLIFTAGKTLTLTESLTLNALPIGGLAVATAANTLGSLAVGATTEILVGGGAGVVPVWTTVTGTGAPVKAASPTLSGTPLTTAPADNIATTQIATAAFVKSQIASLANPKAMSQAINTVVAAAPTPGVTVVDNANIDFGTGNYTIRWKGSLPDWTPAATTRILCKMVDTSNRWLLYVNITTGYLGYLHRLTGGTSVDASTTVATGLIDGQVADIVAVITRETAGVAGSVAFYLNGVLLETIAIAAGTPANIDNAGSLYINGELYGGRLSGTVSDVSTFNRALTAAQVLDLYRNGIAFADKWGNQTGPVSGCTLALEPEGIQADKWYDSSNNNLDASYPTSGSILNRKLVKGIMQPTPTAKTVAVTLTIAELLTGLLTGTHAVGATQAYVVPTGTLCDAGGSFNINDSFDWVLINLSAAVADTITVTAGTGHTVVGNMVVQSAHATTGALYGNSAQFRTRKTAANTFITYRIA